MGVLPATKIQHRRQDMLDPPGQAGRLSPGITRFPASGAACTPVSNASALTSRVYLMYHAGRTITELPRPPGNTAPARTFGVGTWHYDPDADTYYVSFRFDCYANGVLQGYQTVEREIKPDASGNTLSGPAVSVRYLENGVEVYSQCGSGTATRI